MRKKTLVLGLGNPILTDDGVGVLVGGFVGVGVKVGVYVEVGLIGVGLGCVGEGSIVEVAPGALQAAIGLDEETARLPIGDEDQGRGDPVSQHRSR